MVLRILGCKLLLFLFFIISSSVEADVNVENEKITLSGVIQIVYMRYVSQTQLQEINNNFYINRSGISLRGIITKSVGYRFIFVPDKSHVIGFFDAYGFVKLPYSELYIGQFKSPFSMERLISFTRREFVNNALATGLVAPRDFGVGVFGDSKYAEFNLAIINGTGLNKSEENSKKDYIGRLVFKPLKHTRIGAAVYLGQSGPDANLAKRNRYNLQTEYKTPKYHLRSEYILFEDGSVKGFDYYLQGGYSLKVEKFFLEEVEPVARYEFNDPDKDISKDSQWLLTIGLNFYLDGYRLRAQANYLRKTPETGKKTNEFYLAVQFML